MHLYKLSWTPKRPWTIDTGDTHVHLGDIGRLKVLKNDRFSWKIHGFPWFCWGVLCLGIWGFPVCFNAFARTFTSVSRPLWVIQPPKSPGPAGGAVSVAATDLDGVPAESSKMLGFLPKTRISWFYGLVPEKWLLRLSPDRARDAAPPYAHSQGNTQLRVIAGPLHNGTIECEPLLTQNRQENAIMPSKI